MTIKRNKIKQPKKTVKKKGFNKKKFIQFIIMNLAIFISQLLGLDGTIPGTLVVGENGSPSESLEMIIDQPFFYIFFSLGLSYIIIYKICKD